MKNGFTLIELLAVIVILAIIALIATPIVLYIIEESKDSAMLRSADGYLDAVEYSIAKAVLNNKNIKDGKYNIIEDGNLCLEYTDKKCSNVLEVETKGEVPNSGIIQITNGNIDKIGLTYSNNQTIIKENNKLVFGEFTDSLLAPGLYDDNNNLIYTWDELIENSLLTIDNNWLIDMDNSVSGKLVIPSSVTSIGVGAFDGCTSLTSITIPNSVTSIGEYAFRNCTSLTSIIIPDSVTYIEIATFEGCTNLTNIVIPDSVTGIHYDAFRNCTSLTSVTIPDSVTSIGDCAFENCTSLTSIIIPYSVTGIGFSVFSGCTSLTSFTIGSGATSTISEHWSELFDGSTSLTSVTIGKGVTHIYTSFSNLPALTTINYEGTEEEWKKVRCGEDEMLCYNMDYFPVTLPNFRC